jgi:putative phosphoesterase
LKIVLLGDIHANLPALEAVLAHAAQQEAQQIWNVGDFIGYGAFPNEVIELMQQEEAISIAGNYDLKVLRFPDKVAKWRRSKKPEKLRAFEWAYQTLKPQNMAYLGELPQEVRIEVEGWRVLLTHASPESNEEYIGAETSEERLRWLAAAASADIVACGHSHVGFARCVDGVWFINPGSVGRPDDGDPRASYALVEIDPDAVHVEHIRLAYDLERAAAAVEAQHLPEEFAAMIRLGRNLDWVQKQALITSSRSSQ